LSAPQPPPWHAAVEVLGGVLVVLHLPLFLLHPPAGALALLLGAVLFALGRALSRRWARDELLRRVDQVQAPPKPEPRKPERQATASGATCRPLPTLAAQIGGSTGIESNGRLSASPGPLG
jgi:drug/metabolite transporter (DMT)-like permease